MKILSLFDGISCARVALDRSKHVVERYFASEIDKYAIQVSEKNYKDIIHIGDVRYVAHKDAPIHYKLNDIDLLIGGSPCQDLSIAKKDRKGLDGERSGLFWEYVRILKEVKPKYFILENVNSMPKEAKDTITEALGVEPIMINAALVSAQNRKRLFWTNIPNVTQPEDRGILLKDILEDGCVDRNKSHCIDANYHKGASLKQYLTKGRRQLVMKEKSNTIRIGGRGSELGSKQEWDSVYQYRRTYWRETKGGKVPTLTANMGTGGNNVPYVGNKPEIRKLTCVECERLQNLPDNYTEGVSNTQRYKALGNAFNVDVVAHILSFIPKP